jgi:hypothetical protein
MAVLMNSPPLSRSIPLKGDEEGSTDLIHDLSDQAMGLVLEGPILGPLGSDIGTVKVKSNRRFANVPEALPMLSETVSISRKRGSVLQSNGTP